ncbi:unnamed protein product [Citrullus colocynthis]|uniref:Uncharacterized protein n=1 Tax=Citrullus colocynthis TaxID=252529 RepID=A0ABP0YE90_9ROSI
MRGGRIENVLFRREGTEEGEAGKLRNAANLRRATDRRGEILRRREDRDGGLGIRTICRVVGMFEKVTGEKLMESDSCPRLEAWSRGFMAAPAIRESRADQIGWWRVRLLQRSSLDPNLKNVVRVLGALLMCL